MATLLRHILDDLVVLLERRAQQTGGGTERELRDTAHRILAEKNLVLFEDVAAVLRDLLSDRQHTPSELLVRETRDAR